MAKITHIRNKSTIKRENPVTQEPEVLNTETKTKPKKFKVKNLGIKVALVCIAKNEDDYIQEWIDYNLKLGFDHIYIYQNDWRCSIEHPNITNIEYDGVGRQNEAYNDFMQERSSNYDWVAYFDVDEFLVLKKHFSIKDFINSYMEYNVIGINWRLFGDNGLTEKGDDLSVLKRFTKGQKDLNPHVKSIVKVTDPPMRVGLHTSEKENVLVVGTNGKTFVGPFNYEGDYRIAQLNHYFTKTKQEFIEKCARGRASINLFRKVEEFDEHNPNEVDDFAARDFLYS
jgi:hypothetical protein